MSTRTNFYLDGTKVNPPKNWKALKLELNFDKEKISESVNINNWDFVRENADTVNNRVAQGLTGGVGIFEGIPIRIEIDRNGTIENPFDGYLDLPNGNYSCNEVNIGSKERKQIDWLNDVSDGFTFEYLYKEEGLITKNDFKFMPYVISSLPDYQKSAIALVSAFILRQEVENANKKLEDISISLTNPFESTAILRAILIIIYLTSLILTLINLIKDVILFLIQPVKYHACMSIKKLCEVGAKHLGLSFTSPILNSPEYEDAVIMPEKFFNPVNSTDSRILGFTIPNKNKQEGYFKGTYGDLLRALKTVFKAKILIQNDTIHLIRRDQTLGQPQYQMPDVRQLFKTYNTQDFKSNYVVAFQTDLSDDNTITDYQGTSFQVILRPNVINNADLVLTTGLEEARIPFALAKRKEDLTIVEEIIKVGLQIFEAVLGVAVIVVNGLIAIANLIVKTLNAIIKALKLVGIKVKWQIKPIPKLKKFNLTNLIENRKGMLLLEADYFNTPKIFILKEGNKDRNNKISDENKTNFSAKYLYDNFHFVDSFLPSQEKPNANQYIIQSFEKVPFCFDDYQKVKQNNFIFVKGKIGEVDSLKWDVYNQHADITVRVNELYTNNLKPIYLEPTGA